MSIKNLFIIFALSLTSFAAKAQYGLLTFVDLAPKAVGDRTQTGVPLLRYIDNTIVQLTSGDTEVVAVSSYKILCEVPRGYTMYLINETEDGRHEVVKTWKSGTANMYFTVWPKKKLNIVYVKN